MYSVYQFKKNQAKSQRLLSSKKEPTVNNEHSRQRVKQWVTHHLQEDKELQRILTQGTIGCKNTYHYQYRDLSSRGNIYLRHYIPEKQRVDQSVTNYKNLHLDSERFTENRNILARKFQKHTKIPETDIKTPDRLIFTRPSTGIITGKQKNPRNFMCLSRKSPWEPAPIGTPGPYAEAQRDIAREREKSKELSSKFDLFSKPDVWSVNVKTPTSLNSFVSEKSFSKYQNSRIYRHSSEISFINKYTFR